MKGHASAEQPHARSQCLEDLGRTFYVNGRAAPPSDARRWAGFGWAALSPDAAPAAAVDPDPPSGSIRSFVFGIAQCMLCWTCSFMPSQFL
uniref:Uncharacterized protein n=1 Tax=Anopheles dirus TaxID=7168 RepID=A0A182MZW9_9DIPT